MKKFGAFLGFLTLLLVLVACNQNSNPTTQTHTTHPTTGMATTSRPFPTVPPTVPTTSSALPTVHTTLPTIPTTVPTAPTTIPTVPTTLPTIPTTIPTIPTTLPVIPSTTITIPTTFPTIPTTLPTIPTTQPTVPTTVPTASSTTTPQPEWTRPNAQTHDMQVLQGKWVIIECNFVNLRTSPDVTAASKRQISVGEEVDFLGWYGKFARVRYKGQTGYVMGSYVAPAGDYMQQALDTVAVTGFYNYEEMMEDLRRFAYLYPEQVELEIIGSSAWGTEIPVIRVGNENASKHVLMHGSVHAREYTTTWLLMALVDYWLDRGLAGYGDVCFHIIPMVNPDGVSIVQSGVIPEELMHIYENDLKNGYTNLTMELYANQWKANGQGVDINRNFPSGWELITSRNEPSSELYRGTEPFSAPEAKMLRDYSLRYAFDATVSYHATGSIIYYEYGDNAVTNAIGKTLAQKLYGLTGYYPFGSANVDGAGYKDWMIAENKVPSLTMEIGCQGLPLANRELYSTFVRNLEVFPAIIRWLLQ